MPKVVFNPLTQDFDFTGSGGGSGPSVTNDQLQDQELTATYAYVGYENTADNSWYIYRRTRATNLREYATGATDYATNWTGRAGLTYV